MLTRRTAPTTNRPRFERLNAARVMVMLACIKLNTTDRDRRCWFYETATVNDIRRVWLTSVRTTFLHVHPQCYVSAMARLQIDSNEWERKDIPLRHHNECSFLFSTSLNMLGPPKAGRVEVARPRSNRERGPQQTLPYSFCCRLSSCRGERAWGDDLDRVSG